MSGFFECISDIDIIFSRFQNRIVAFPRDTLSAPPDVRQYVFQLFVLIRIIEFCTM
jgi:hypothetical protein